MVVAMRMSKVKNAVERLFKIVDHIEIDTNLNTSSKVALNFWLIDSETLKNEKPIDQLHDLVTAIFNRGKLESTTRDALLKICLEHIDPPDYNEDVRLREF
jgi:hypothetical protein